MVLGHDERDHPGIVGVGLTHADTIPGENPIPPRCSASPANSACTRGSPPVTIMPYCILAYTTSAESSFTFRPCCRAPRY